MPDPAAHLSACKSHFQSYGDTLEKHPDWAAVILFYCAVHTVEHFFSLDNKHHTEHSSRDFELKANFQSLWPDYRVLKSESLKTRYLEGGAFSLTPAQVDKKMLPRLRRIESDITARIAAKRIPGMPTLPGGPDAPAIPSPS